MAVMQWRKLGFFLAGFATVAPWLIFNFVYRLGFSPFRTEIGWHSDAGMLFLNTVFNNPTSGILWILLFVCLIYTAVNMFRDSTGRALIVIFTIAFGSIAFVFTSTAAYSFLNDQTTIHRTLMQLSSVAIVIAMYGLSLRIRQNL